jgi:hypothetical protein
VNPRPAGGDPIFCGFVRGKQPAGGVALRAERRALSQGRFRIAEAVLPAIGSILLPQQAEFAIIAFDGPIRPR